MYKSISIYKRKTLHSSPLSAFNSKIASVIKHLVFPQICRWVYLLREFQFDMLRRQTQSKFLIFIAAASNNKKIDNEVRLI